MFQDCQEFTKRIELKTGKKPSGKINREFIITMVNDELQELREANDEAEEVDALLDATYYILQHLAQTGLDIRPIWDRIHAANMSKFSDDGHMDERGKWIKPSNFVAPDEDIRKIIKKQRDEQAANASKQPSAQP